MTAVPKTIDEYLAPLPRDQRAALENVRKTIRAAAPKAEECISYQIPTFRQDGMLVSFGAWKEHCALYGLSSRLPDELVRELAGYDTSKGTIRFRPEAPLPATLVKKLVKARLAENAARAALRTAKKSAKAPAKLPRALGSTQAATKRTSALRSPQPVAKRAPTANSAKVPTKRASAVGPNASATQRARAASSTKAAAKRAPAAKSGAARKSTAVPARRAPAKSRAPAPAASSRIDPAVAAFLRELEHPLKAEIEAVREWILAASSDVREGIKWNAPSFRTSDWFATFHLRSKDGVQLVFHTGAKVKASAKTGLAIADPTGLVKWLAKDRGLVTLGSGAELRAQREAFQALVRAWIRAL